MQRLLAIRDDMRRGDWEIEVKVMLYVLLMCLYMRCLHVCCCFICARIRCFYVWCCLCVLICAAYMCPNALLICGLLLIFSRVCNSTFTNGDVVKRRRRAWRSTTRTSGTHDPLSVLRTRCAMPGTTSVFFIICLHTRCAMPGTERGYAASRDLLCDDQKKKHDVLTDKNSGMPYALWCYGATKCYNVLVRWYNAAMAMLLWLCCYAPAAP
eukprot:590286-Rhodomonas_salina.1